MDVARMITDVAAELYRQECENGMVKIEISMMMGRYITEIHFVPLSRNMLIRYKSMEYKVCRRDCANFEEVCNFILNQIVHDIFMCFVGEDVEEMENSEYNIISLTKNGEAAFQRNVTFASFKDNVMEYIMPLRFLN